jgi:hypothetical protein
MNKGTHASRDPRPGQTHIRALNRALKAAGAQLTEQDDALVETLRTLARQMDDAGGNPGTRLTACYLSAQRDLGRLLAATRSRQAAGPSKLQLLRAERDAGRQAG